MSRNRDPRTKEELLDRMLSFDFNGDIRHLGREPASVVRLGANRLKLAFPDSGRAFELSVHIPREREERSFGPHRSNEPPFPEAETAATLREREREKQREAKEWEREEARHAKSERGKAGSRSRQASR